MKTSKNGLSLIEYFEGLRLGAYQDGNGIWTIGYGHTGPEVKKGLSISKEEAEDHLAKDVAIAEGAVSHSVRVVLNQNQFDALVAFVYNIGAGRFIKSTLLKKLNSGDYSGASQQILVWNLVDGLPSLGLEKRRKAEQELFLR